MLASKFLGNPNILELAISEWGKADKEIAQFEQLGISVYVLSSRDSNGQEVISYVPTPLDGRFFVPEPLPEQRRRLSGFGRAIVFGAAVDHAADQLCQTEPEKAIKVLGEGTYSCYYDRSVKAAKEKLERMARVSGKQFFLQRV